MTDKYNALIVVLESEASHSDEQRQAKKLLCYAVDEVVRTHFPEESFAGYRNRVFEAIFGGLN